MSKEIDALDQENQHKLDQFSEERAVIFERINATVQVLLVS